jgi:hypothetical protein
MDEESQALQLRVGKYGEERDVDGPTFTSKSPSL